jgi:exodeoxyribonuclease V alpha subunit
MQIEPCTSLDRHFAALMADMSSGHRSDTGLAALLASMAVSEGGTCLRLAQWAGQVVGDANGQRAPDLTLWRRRLMASGVVGVPGERMPLVLDSGDRLYLYRYWYYENEIARRLEERAQWTDRDVPEYLETAVSRVFPDSDAGMGTNWQQIAAVVAAHKRVCVISGGPGTGKTTTAVRLIALLQDLAPSPLRVVMAAPTGKAAGRLMESMASALAAVRGDPAGYPVEALTLHRLLGYDRRHGRPAYREDHPLPVDVLVIDEASMVDISLMHAVLAALPATCRLILIGDRHQLASVEAGSVFGDICHPAAGSRFSTSMRKRLQPWLDNRGTGDPGQAVSPLADCMVYLEKRFRFDGAPHIAELADAVLAGKGAAAARMLAGDPGEDGWVTPDASRGIDAFVTPLIQNRHRAVLGSDSPRSALEAMKQVQILCAVNHGIRGVAACNRMAEALLISDPSRPKDASSEWYPGRPVLITRNDYETGLFNGDVGVTLEAPDTPGGRRICVDRHAGELVCVHPRQLPEHEPAHAITVHKSQGSEFAHVVLILPDQALPMLSRELIYTGISRARQRVTVVGDTDIWEQAIGRVMVRPSGLRDILWPALTAAGQIG